MAAKKKFGDDASVACTVQNGIIQAGTNLAMPVNPPSATVIEYDEGDTIMLSPDDAARLSQLGTVEINED